MKFATIASMCLAVTAAPRFADGGGFDELMALVEQLHEEATALSTKYGGMDAEITSLIDQISRCEGGGGGGSDTSTTSDGTEEGESQTFGDDGDDGSSSSGGGGQTEETSSSGGGGEGYPSSTPAPSAAQPLSDDPQDTTADETSGSGTNSPSGSGSDVPDNGGGGGGGGGGDFKFSVGQSWNYNLATPVNLDVNVDVFFIDMGEREFLLRFCVLCFFVDRNSVLRIWCGDIRRHEYYCYCCCCLLFIGGERCCRLRARAVVAVGVGTGAGAADCALCVSLYGGVAVLVVRWLAPARGGSCVFFCLCTSTLVPARAFFFELSSSFSPRAKKATTTRHHQQQNNSWK